MIKLFRFLKPYIIPIFVVVILIFFQSIADLSLPTLMSDIVNTGIINNDISYIIKTGGSMLLVAIGGVICAILSGFLSAQIAIGFGRILRSKLFVHITNFSLNEFDKFGTPSLVTRNTNDITQVQTVTFIILRMMFMAPITCTGGIIMAISKDKELAWVIIIVIPILVTVIMIIVSKVFPLFRSIQVKIDKINLILRERLTGIRVIRAFNRDDNEKKRFENANIDLTNTTIKVNRIMAFAMPSIMLIMNFTSISIIWFGSIRIEHGSTNVGNMMAFLQYAMQIMFALLMATLMFIMIPRAQASAERINEVLAVDSKIINPVVRKKTWIKKGYIKFKNVTFRYLGAEEAAIKNISFSASPGEVTAIIGSTGSGKSTLINLIPRFYDIESGNIELDGVDIRDIGMDDLRSKIGFVPQKALLFTGTISDNIKFGKNDATEEEIHHAAEVSQSSEFILSMKEGYNSLISQGGRNLSGGQKQRLSIARALVCKPEIYIFDDCFSALDFKTDAKLRSCLKNEILESTVIIVSQRVATIMDADRIIVLDEGKVMGIGKHKDLFKNNKVYQEIVFSQLSKEEIE